MFYICDECKSVWAKVLNAEVVPNCCGQAMLKLKPKQPDAEHLVIIDFSDDRVRVTVGENSHPMELDHKIEFIALRTRDRISIKKLTRSKRASAVFYGVGAEFKVYIYCSKDGLFCDRTKNKDS